VFAGSHSFQTKKSQQNKMSVTEAEVDEFFQSVLLPLLENTMVSFNKIKEIANLLGEDKISNETGSRMFEKIIKEDTDSVLTQREKILQLEEDYPWLKDRFKASSKALCDYCGTQDEKQTTDLETLLITKYQSWNDLLTDKPELKEAKEIHLALVMFTIIRIAYKFRFFSRNIFGLSDYAEAMRKYEEKSRKGQIDQLVKETGLSEKKIRTAFYLLDFKQSMRMTKDQWKQVEEMYTQESSLQ